MDTSLVLTIAFTIVPTAVIIVLVFVAARAVRAAKAKGESQGKA